MSKTEQTNPRCVAITKQGDQCLNAARDGAVTCYVHRNYAPDPLTLSTADIEDSVEDFAAEMTEPAAELFDDVTEIAQDAADDVDVNAADDTAMGNSDDAAFARIAEELLAPEISLLRDVVQLDPNAPSMSEDTGSTAARDSTTDQTRAGAAPNTATGNPNIKVDYKNKPGAKDSGLAMVLEIVGSIFGLMGIGWIYAGRLEIGLGWMIGYWVFTVFMIVFDLITLSIGLCLHIPLAIGVWALSAYLLRRYLDGNPINFKN